MVSFNQWVKFDVGIQRFYQSISGSKRGHTSGGPRGGIGPCSLPPGPDHQAKIVLKMTVLDT